VAAEPHFTWPVVDDETRRAVMDQLGDSISIYNRAGVIERLEEQIKAFTGVRYVLLTSSGTAALHSLYVALGLQPGDEVICPAYTFYATVTPLFFTGATPVLADCDWRGNIDPGRVAAAISERTKAIMVTHMWGTPCQMDELQAIADEHDLPLVEDASHAYGATFHGKRAGSLGHAAALSLQGQKPLTGGEGGVLLTSDAEVYYRAIALGHYNRRCKDEIPADHWLSEFAVTGMGLKLRIHPLAAAIAEQQHRALDEFMAGREKTAAKMTQALEQLPGVSVVQPPAGSTSSWYALIVRVDPRVVPVPAAELHRELLAEGAAEVDRPGSTCPLPQLPLFQRPGVIFPAYRDVVMPTMDSFPRAAEFHRSILKLPVWHQADEAVVNQYLEAFRRVWARRGI
jgi:dTDP-4-amino-4,6-dideoxygalactose transaminase